MKKKLLYSVLALFLAVSISYAQNPQPLPAERAKKTVERLKQELSLTEQQEKDILPVYTDFYTSMRKLMENGRPSPEERQKEMEARNEKLRKTLSEDQMKKLAEAEQKMREERRKNGGGQ
ncbi:MAG: hypothetical protein V4717_02720 [Bacteroidota bacterium]